jgi:predicted metal-dependent hydrolase
VSVRVEEIKKLFAEALREITHRRAVPEIEVGFYPFAGLNNYIHIRQGRVLVKLSDLLERAPRSVHEALAYILVAKLFCKAVNRRYQDIYRAWAAHPEVVHRVEQVVRRRGKKRIIGPRGRYRDLAEAFERLNRRHFAGGLKKPTLTWSLRRSRTVLGHLDHTHNTLVISRLLDDPQIPEFVFEYVLYHEMLHLVHRPKTIRGKRYFHTTEFQQDEKKFPRYAEAQAWIARIAQRRAVR